MAILKRSIVLCACAALLSGCFKSDVNVQYHPEYRKSISNSKKTHPLPAFYVVRKGDTLFTIGDRFGIDYKRIASRNNITPPYQIHVGQRLHLTRNTYNVRRGDTLYMIAQRFALDYKDLARRNYIYPPYQIYVGQQLVLHGMAAKARSIPIPKAKPAPAPKTTIASKPAVIKTVPKPSASKTPQSPVAQSGPIDLQWPLQGSISSEFGQRNGKMHDGIDVVAALKTPIHAAERGTVVYAGQQLSGYGKMIIIRHAQNIHTVYAHNHQNVVKAGDTVQQGDLIAYLGNTGRSTSPHLHFEVRHSSTPVDPLDYLPKKRKG